jgi:hypothetical protein
VFGDHKEWGNEEVRSLGIKFLAEKWARGGRGFVPLVTEEMCLKCSLDILFLRPDVSGKLFQGGDIDNRLKTLFDALRLPQHAEGMGAVPVDVDEDPMYCLLEDDSLITEVRIVTDQLLLLPRETEAHPNDVFLVIDVKLETPAHAEWAFLFG